MIQKMVTSFTALDTTGLISSTDSKDMLKEILALAKEKGKALLVKNLEKGT